MIISKSPADKFMVGIDLTDEYCQISYLYNKRARFGRGFINAATGGVLREPVTFSTVPDMEAYNIPLALCKRKGSPVWLVGTDALEAGRQGEGTVVTSLLQKAREEAVSLIEGEKYNGVALLALFLHRCLALLEPVMAPDQIAAVTFTAPEMDYALEQVILRAFGRTGLGVPQVVCESHEESFFYYMLMQEAEQRRSGMLLCEYGEGAEVTFTTLHCNRKTSPIVYWTESRSRQMTENLPPAAKDREFSLAVLDLLEKEEISSAYLTGPGFEGGWIKDAAVLLCRGRRVFQGENLFGKGASYSALFHADRPSEIPESVFLSKDALRSNIGIDVLLREQMGYHALLDAGTKWYNAEAEEDFILENGREFSLVRTPVTGGESVKLTVRLDGIPERPDRATRIRVLLTMPRAGCLKVHVTDMGFGEIFPAGGGIWEETFEV